MILRRFQACEDCAIFFTMPAVTVKIPNVRPKMLINNKKYLFWLFVTIISVLVIAIISLIIVSSTKRDFVNHPLTSYHAGCTDLTSQWHVGENGASGTIKVILKTKIKSLNLCYFGLDQKRKIRMGLYLGA